MASTDEIGAVRTALGDLERAVNALRQRAGDTLGVRRLCTDVRRISEDLAEIGPLPAPDPDPPRAPAHGNAAVGPLEAVPDSDIYPASWEDTDDEGVGGWHHPLAQRRD
jgi:hypothetical protein